MTAEGDHRRRSAKSPTTFGHVQVLDRTGLAAWQWEAGAAAGLIPAADADGRWSAAAAAAIAARREDIVAAVGTDAPVGGHRAAGRLAERTGLDVQKPDVEALAAAGLLMAAGAFKGWPLWTGRDLDTLDVEGIAAVVGERQAWLAASVSRWDAPAYLGWHRRDFERAVARRGLQLGPLDRYARADLDALAADGDLAADRRLVVLQAADHLEIRPADFGYLVAGDLAVPHSYASVRVSRYRLGGRAAVPGRGPGRTARASWHRLGSRPRGLGGRDYARSKRHTSMT